MRSRSVLRSPLVGLLSIALAGGAASPGWADAGAERSCGPPPMPAAGKPLQENQRLFFEWLGKRCYAELGWQKDKRVRDTGPYLFGQSYGLHPAVRIYYSPDVISWLERGRPDSGLERGATIVKEMFEAPAARYTEREFERVRAEPGYDGPAGYDAWVASKLSGWTAMIKTGDTWDGWFWATPSVPEDPAGPDPFREQLSTNDPPFNLHYSEFGQPSCLRCHAVAESESTFSDLRNIEGEPGEPTRFKVDNSWRDDLERWQRPAGGETEQQLVAAAFHGAPTPLLPSTPDATRHPDPRPSFSDYFDLPTDRRLEPADFTFPGQWADHVPAGPGGSEQFITSDNCLGCHGGLGGPPYAISMFVKTGADYGAGYNISPYGEWRWSPMGLAGRDPIFHAQLETEVAIIRGYDLPRLEKEHGRKQANEMAAELILALQDTCLSCHGAMGQRQLLIDYRDAGLDPDMLPEYLYLYGALTAKDLEQENYEYHKYGNLAREGISCAVCHHIEPPDPDPAPPRCVDGGEDEGREPGYRELRNFLMHSTTGVFPYSPPGVLNGPFDDVQVKPMQQALAITPKFNAYVKDSKMCGTCHTINLPNVDGTRHPYPCLDEAARNAADAIQERYGVDYAQRLAGFPHSIEQATYLEWENSSFSQPGSFNKSCQECHMPRSFRAETDSGTIHIDPVVSQIATIQDSTYPAVDHGLPDAEVEVPLRDDYRRHELVGLNAFLLEMTRQFDDVLGLAQTDYMTSATTGNAFAIENVQRQAREQTVALSVDGLGIDDGTLTADVTLRNLTGHRFPSGVAFRRAWIELVLTDESSGETLFASGRSNEFGLLVDMEGEVLPSEFHAGGDYQPHFDGTVPETTPITRDGQVQIYQELVKNAAGDFTYSFVHRDTHVKDNRLLPRGYRASAEFQDPLVREFMEATDPDGTGADPDYLSRAGETFAGQDTVRYRVALPDGVGAADLRLDVNVYSQAVTPFWLQEKFTWAPEGVATQRLYYIASRLETGPGSPIAGWKLPLASFSGPVTGSGD